MNKQQKKIYNWLTKRPGYLKKSAEAIVDIISDDVTLKDVTVALKEAKLKKDKSKISIIDRAKKVPVQIKKQVDYTFNNSNFTRKLTTPGLYFIFGCVHAPFHKKDAFKAVFQLLKDNRESIVGVVLAGDFLDMNSLSSHDKGKKPLMGVTLDWEYSEANDLLDDLFEPLSKNINKVYLYGNHEDRYFRYMNDIDNSKLGKSLPSPEIGLNLQDRGFRLLTNWKEDHITLGNYLDVSHGEFINVHTAKKHIDTYRRSTLFYHTHRVQQYIEGQVGGYNGGSMADFTEPVFNYASRAMKGSWLNGFTAVHVDEQGYYHIQQIVCYNNSFVFGNKIYKY